MKYVFVFVSVYALLFAHKQYTRLQSSPAPSYSSSVSDSFSEDSLPTQQIRDILANERDGTGPLSQAFEVLAANSNPTKAKQALEFQPSAFQFLSEEGETPESFVEKLANYSRSEQAQDYGTRKDLLNYSLSLSLEEQSSLVQVSLSVLEGLSPEDPSAQKEELIGLAVSLLRKQISDPYRFESLKDEIRNIHKDDPNFLEIFDSAISTTDH